MPREANIDQIRITEENALAYYRGIARLLGGEFHEEDQITWFTTGRRSLLRFNAALRTAVTRPAELGRVVDPVFDYFVSRSLPFFWVDWPAVGTPGLGEYLASRRVPLLRFTMPAMARPLREGPQVSPPKDVDIVRVQTPPDQADWLNVLMDGFEEPEAARPDFQQFLAGSLSEPQPVFEHLLARWRGEPCAIATVLHARRAAGIYHVTTLPAFRGRGLGGALTLAAMGAARNAGASTAILFATPSGYPLYQRLGFETVTTADLFGWNGPDQSY